MTEADWIQLIIKVFIRVVFLQILFCLLTDQMSRGFFPRTMSSIYLKSDLKCAQHEQPVCKNAGFTSSLLQTLMWSDDINIIVANSGPDVAFLPWCCICNLLSLYQPGALGLVLVVSWTVSQITRGPRQPEGKQEEKRFFLFSLNNPGNHLLLLAWVWQDAAGKRWNNTITHLLEILAKRLQVRRCTSLNWSKLKYQIVSEQLLNGFPWNVFQDELTLPLFSSHHQIQSSNTLIYDRIPATLTAFSTSAFLYVWC